MINNFFYSLDRRQRICLNFLGIAFLVVSALWFLIELMGYKFPIEPLVVFIGGLATFLASYWPWKPKYQRERMNGKVSFDYSSNNGEYSIGRDSNKFTLRFTKASDTCIHMYVSDNVKEIALAGPIPFSTIRDATQFNFSSNHVTPKIDDVVVIKNGNGDYAIIKIINILDRNRTDNCDELTFGFSINPAGKTDFS